MITYNIGNGFSIRQFDSKNWVVEELKLSKKEEDAEAGVMVNEVLGYYPTLTMAKSGAAKYVSLEADSHKELMEACEIILKIRQS